MSLQRKREISRSTSLKDELVVLLAREGIEIHESTDATWTDWAEIKLNDTYAIIISYDNPHHCDRESYDIYSVLESGMALVAPCEAIADVITELKRRIA